jgi:heme oxygenase (biliverdin-producing, ferredoxin)
VTTKFCAVTPFTSTGLERSDALSRDIEWLCSSKSVEPLAFRESGPGNTYVQKLQSLAAEDIPAFMCHWYNVNFAHTAGGRMIGKAVSDRILDGAELDFYTYNGDVKELGDKVKEDLEAVAQSWTEEDRQRSVEQTPEAFKYSGALLKCITQSCDCDCPRREVTDPAPEKSLVAK